MFEKEHRRNFGHFGFIIGPIILCQERMQYTPLGWSKSYEVTEADLTWADRVIDTWVDTAAQGRPHLPPTSIPWAALPRALQSSPLRPKQMYLRTESHK